MNNAHHEKIQPLARDTNAALCQVMGTMAYLQDVYVEETEALISVDSQKFLELQDKKLIAARRYQAHIGEMVERKDEIKNADSLIKEKLKAMQNEFLDLSNKNLEALERMQRCTDRLAETIRNAAIRTARSQRTFSYGETGAISNSAKNKVISSGLSETA